MAAFEKKINAIQSGTYTRETDYSSGKAAKLGQLRLEKGADEHWDEIAPLLASMKYSDIKKVYADWAFPLTDSRIQAITQLANLEDLSASKCDQLTDVGIQALTACRNLRRLKLTVAHGVTAKGWETLTSFPALRELELPETKLTGEIAFLAKLPSLTKLDVASSEISDADLAPLDVLTNLKSLDLSGNPSVTDAGVSRVEKMKQLESLWLKETKLTDAGLRAVSGLESLRSLGIASTGVTDAGFVHLSGLSSLWVLSTDNCKLRDDGFKHLATCRALEYLKISGCPEITGTGLGHLATTYVGSLDLKETGITDAGLEKLKTLTKVTILDLPRYGDVSNKDEHQFWQDLHPERLTDVGLKHLASMSNLQQLYISGGGITDAGLAHLSGLSKLEKLELGACPEVTGAGLKHLAKLPLYSLNLGETCVTDESLPSLAGIASLKALTLPPIVTAKAEQEYQSSHPKVSVHREFDYSSLAIKAKINGGPLTDAELSALNALKELGAYTSTTESTNLLNESYAYSEDQQKEFFKHFQLLRKSSLSELSLAQEVSPELFKVICELKHLKELTISNASKLTDAEFTAIGNCPKLKNLTVKNGVKLTGAGMAGLSKLKQLRLLSFEGVRLGIAGIKALQSNPQLEFVYLKKCDLTDSDLPPLAGLQTLKTLNLSENSRITGSGLADCAKLPNLSSLDLAETACVDASMEAIGRIAKLGSLDLTATKVTDAGILNLKPAKQLVVLDLPSGTIRGSGFAAFRDSKNFGIVKIGTNPEITGEGLENLAESRVTELDLSNTGITDAGLAKIAELKGLKKLSLPEYGNGFPNADDKPSLWSDFQPKRLTDAGLKHLVKLQNLEDLSLSGGGITDAGLESIGKLVSLRQLRFSACPNVRGTGFSQLAGLKNLTSVNVSGALITADSLKLLDKLPALESITVGPLISPEVVKENEKSHPGKRMYRQEEYYTPAMKALQAQNSKPAK